MTRDVCFRVQRKTQKVHTRYPYIIEIPTLSILRVAIVVIIVVILPFNTEHATPMTRTIGYVFISVVALLATTLECHGWEWRCPCYPTPTTITTTTTATTSIATCSTVTSTTAAQSKQL